MAQRGAIDVQGLDQLLRAFKAVDKDLDKATTKALKDAAEPAAKAAEQLILGNISNMPLSPRWAGQRVGISRRQGEVYIVPKAKRRSRTGRTNLSGLMGPLMELAVEDKAADIEDAIGDAIDRLAKSHGF